MPVHRLQARKTHTVHAFKSELDVWRSSRDLSRARLDSAGPADRPPPTPDVRATVDAPRPRAVRQRRWLVAATLCAAFVITAVEGAPLVDRSLRGGTPFRYEFVGHRLEALDSSRRLVWTYDFGRDVSSPSGLDVSPEAGTAEVEIVDSGVEPPVVIVPVRFSRSSEPSARSDALFAFGTDGYPRWIAHPPATIDCADGRYDGPWRLTAVRASSDSRHQVVWASFAHNTFWPSFVLEIGPDGPEHATCRPAGAGP